MRKVKTSFNVVWYMACGCSWWFGVVLCGLGAMVYVYCQVWLNIVRYVTWFLISGVVIRKYETRFKVVWHIV